MGSVDHSRGRIWMLGSHKIAVLWLKPLKTIDALKYLDEEPNFGLIKSSNPKWPLQ